ncbi:hypothetical protein F2P81_025021 [Scophthalmus maximus]|uniref:Ras-related protein Rab-38 n=1 Tax=Scophthalmus maximus TaxID=52904 RepID=A0A6A4RUJ6_SCOMX|nr:hypothetical protein F2P81_025021 [Scophthalmus maximus]
MQIRERFFEHLLKSEKEIPPLLRGQELLTSQGNRFTKNDLVTGAIPQRTVRPARCALLRSCGAVTSSQAQGGRRVRRSEGRPESHTEAELTIWEMTNHPSHSNGMQSLRKEHLYKVLVIGDLGVGKTSVIRRYVHQSYSNNYRATIGVDFALKVLNWDSETVRLQLWDIAEGLVNICQPGRALSPDNGDTCRRGTVMCKAAAGPRECAVPWEYTGPAAAAAAFLTLQKMREHNEKLSSD